MRKHLTDDVIASLAPKSKRYMIYDKIVPELAVRVSVRGLKSFVIVSRFGGAKHPTRRKLGLVGRMTLDQARERARGYHLAKPTDNFDTVAERYIDHIRHQRRALDVERCIRREFIKRWENRPIGSITKDDVLEVIDAAVKRGSPYAAHHAWSYASRLWNWAIARGIVDRSPCDRTRPSTIIGRKEPRQRVLSDDEMRKLWKATQLMGSFGRLVQLLLATGARKSEALHARRSELVIDEQFWEIPALRFKSNRKHIVPLSQLSLDIINALPDNGERLFDVRDFAASKKALDVLMKDVPHFVIHDLRRTVRTRLTPLTTHEVAEAVIGHQKTGLNRVYNLYEYLDEKRDALDAWAARLSGIVSDKRS